MKLLASLILTGAALAVSPASFAAQGAPAPAKADLAKGEAKYAAVCAACHGADGNSAIPANPKLAQQHPQYLAKQLQEFKSGQRGNAVMKQFASDLSEEDMKNISAWLASKQSKAGFA
ncbi:MAG: c-type cytochrome, partial [Hylemonella sp.]